jgi:hypothetical protein
MIPKTTIKRFRKTGFTFGVQGEGKVMSRRQAEAAQTFRHTSSEGLERAHQHPNSGMPAEAEFAGPAYT